MIVSKSFRWSECRAIAASVAAVAMGISANAQSDEHPLDTLQVHGFLSQALVTTDDNNFFGHSSRDKGSLEFTEIGLNVSLRPHQDVLVAAQLLSRRAGGDSSDAKPELDYGLIDYQMASNQQRTFGVQLGRFKNPFGFYNQTRDVAFTRPSILLPQSIYFDRTRSIALAADGVSIYLDERVPTGSLRIRSGLGLPQTGSDLARQLFAGNGRPSISSGDYSVIAQLLYEHENSNFVAAISAADVNLDTNFPEGAGTFDFQPWIASIQYNQELWSLTGEFALRKQSLQGNNIPRNFEITGQSWYLQYQRMINQKWSWLVRYDSLINNNEDRSGNSFEANGLGPAHSQFADDLTFGLQWTPHPQVMLAGEYHHVDGTGWLPTQDNPDSSATSRRWNMWLFQLSLRF
ncbi:hypothetical protein [Vreelandella boliviensis]|uniref:Porin n=1 Tax=Vreelandella boliviensis LC1 TaxID=1072583 RepID=A0A265DWA7_9GAMM|nr:hypothetical protein [Halomonas boliviensis]EHJ92521.1 hypothetical protein KUC_2477 [Halomonas boliviensis LC1]OZT73603.1 hypothetical protein CE457_13455 [Halomonas boliviensis LC1]